MLIPSRRTVLALLVAGLVSSVAVLARAQGSAEDYERVLSLQEKTAEKVVRDRVNPNWLNGGQQFWYEIRTGKDSSEWVLVDTETGKKQPAFDQTKVAAALKNATGDSFDSTKLNLQSLRLAGDLSNIRFATGGKRWQCDLNDYKLKEIGTQKDETTTAVNVLERPRPSEANGTKSTVRFVNRTLGVVKLLRMDETGERTDEKEIKSDSEHEQATAAGQVWIVIDENERPLGIFEATEKAGIAVIDPPNRSGANFARGAFRGGRGNRNGSALSPDGKWRALIKDSNLVIQNQKTDEEVKLTTTGTTDDPYVARFYWSPDSAHLVGIQESLGEHREINFVESSPKDQLQPKQHTMHYDKPGDKLPVARPRLFDANSGKQVKVAEDLFPNAWSITEVRWPDAKRFTFLFNQRGHQVLRIVSVDAQSGEAKPIVDEKSETFVEYSGKFFSNYLDETNEIVWMSERDGWNHLYLYDAQTGTVKNQVTRGPWVVRGVDQVDKEKRQIWFRAGGIRGEQDPYYVHYCRVNFDGTGLVVLTAGDGTHDVEFSPDRKFLIDTYSRVDMPPVTELRRSDDGSLVCVLEKADWSALLAMGWRAPERFVAKDRNGEYDIYGIIHRPMNFDPAKKYPVIEKIYAGPQGSFVPKNFAAYTDGGGMAELGFIVVQIDGLGTSNRSKKFHDVCCKNLGDSGFPDRIKWMKEAAEKYPQMDLSNVGIYGTSAGGQSALGALLTHPEFYKVAVSDSGCHDNRMDKVWWNELWMGWPIGPHYAAQSSVTLAPNLEGKLLLIVGEMDTNVDPASTMQVVNSLVKANKDFDLLVVPGANHGVGGRSPYGLRRTRDYFVRNLLGVEPRHPSPISDTVKKQDDTKGTKPAS